MIDNLRVAVIIPTLNAGSMIASLVAAIKRELVADDILVIDSSSSDCTVDLAESSGARVVLVPKSNFNHGATREDARKIVDADILVYMSQDVDPIAGFLPKLVAPVAHGEAVIAYSRQVPHLGAGMLEAYLREFNYPPVGETRSIEDTARYGVKNFFCSDSCAAYSRQALDSIGGFRPTLICEDYFATARVLKLGGRIKYVADSVVRHSHRYSLVEEFRRYFDTGYVHAENTWLSAGPKTSESRGHDYFFGLMKRLSADNPYLIPYAILATAVKLLGYRAGLASLESDVSWLRLCSSQSYYWTSRYYGPKVTIV